MPLRGRWIGEARLVTQGGRHLSSPFELLIAERAAPAAQGGAMRWVGQLSLPERHVIDVPIALAKVEDGRLVVGPITLTYDAATDRLLGRLPADLVPRYAADVVLRRVAEAPPRPPRPPLDAPLRAPRWQRALGAPLWADLGGSGDTLLAALDDGQLVALRTDDGAERWRRPLGHMLRAQPVVADGAAFIQDDDGWLHRLRLSDGQSQWRQRVGEQVRRIAPGQPGSRFDLRASAVTVFGDALYVGTHGGRVLALDAGSGRLRWAFDTGGPVLAAPARADGRVLAGSFDHHLYALDASTGRLLWKRPMGGEVSSAPVVRGDRVIVGSRSYELSALALDDGRLLWSNYLWYSWIESTAAVDDELVYVGSSDAAQVAAYALADGSTRWRTDVQAVAWGRPALAGDRLFIGTRATPSLMPHRHAHALALDRASGRVLWRRAIDPPEGAGRDANWGIDASPIVLDGRVFFGCVDGRVLAFDAD